MKNSTKVLCVLLSLIMAMSVFTVLPVGVSAAQVEYAEKTDTAATGTDGVIYFDAASAGWENASSILIYIHDLEEGTFPTWRNKIPLDGTDGTEIGNNIWAFDATNLGVTEGHTYVIIFNNYNTGAQTYDLVMDTSCFKDTAYANPNVLLENPVNCEKSNMEARWRNNNLGPFKQFTSKGNVVGETVPSATIAYQMLVNYLTSILYYVNNRSIQTIIDDVSLSFELKKGDVFLAIRQARDFSVRTDWSNDWNPQQSPLPDGVSFDNLSGTTGDCTWTINGTVLTVSGSGRMGNSPFESPWRYFGITEAIIEDGVTTVSKYAFEKCRSLERVTIGSSLFGIAQGAFSGCKKLQSIVLPDSVQIIADNAFSNCTSLANVTLGNSVTDIGEKAFYNCPALKSVTIPDSADNIDTKAFGYYYNDEFGITLRVPGFRIYGSVTGEAQRYAKAFGFQFERAIAMTGDADGDCMVTVMDVTEVQHSLSGLNTKSNEDITKYADVDQNNRLEIIDATYLQRYTAKITTPYDDIIGAIFSN